MSLRGVQLHLIPTNKVFKAMYFSSHENESKSRMRLFMTLAIPCQRECQHFWLPQDYTVRNVHGRHPESALGQCPFSMPISKRMQLI